MKPIIWVGLDVHKNSTTAAILIGDEQKAQILRLGPDLNELRRLFRKLAKRGPFARATRPPALASWSTGSSSMTGSPVR